MSKHQSLLIVPRTKAYEAMLEAATCSHFYSTPGRSLARLYHLSICCDRRMGKQASEQAIYTINIIMKNREPSFP